MLELWLWGFWIFWVSLQVILFLFSRWFILFIWRRSHKVQLIYIRGQLCAVKGISSLLSGLCRRRRVKGQSSQWWHRHCLTHLFTFSTTDSHISCCRCIRSLLQHWSPLLWYWFLSNISQSAIHAHKHALSPRARASRQPWILIWLIFNNTAASYTIDTLL